MVHGANSTNRWMSFKGLSARSINTESVKRMDSLKRLEWPFQNRSSQSEQSVRSRGNHAHNQTQAINNVHPSHHRRHRLLELVRLRSDAEPNAVSRAGQPGRQFYAAILRQANR